MFCYLDLGRVFGRQSQTGMGAECLEKMKPGESHHAGSRL